MLRTNNYRAKERRTLMNGHHDYALDHYRTMTVLDALALSPSYGYGLSLSTPCVCVCAFRKEEREQGEHKTATYSPSGGKRERERGENIMITSKTTLNPGALLFSLEYNDNEL